MKKLHHITLLCCIGMSSIGQAQTAQVHIAGNNYPVAFGDTNLSMKVRQRIASDLTTALSHVSSFEETKGGEVEDGIFCINRIFIFTLSESEDVLVVDQNNKKSMRVSKVLSDKYLKAFTWVDANSNTVQKAHEFVAMLNSPDLLSKPTQVLLNMGHFEPLSLIQENTPPSDAEIRAMFAKDFYPYKYPKISVLNFYFKEVSEINNAVLPLLFLFAVDKTDPSETGAVPIGFYKGKWGFGSFPTP